MLCGPDARLAASRARRGRDEWPGAGHGRRRGARGRAGADRDREARTDGDPDIRPALTRRTTPADTMTDTTLLNDDPTAYRLTSGSHRAMARRTARSASSAASRAHDA